MLRFSLLSLTNLILAILLLLVMLVIVAQLHIYGWFKAHLLSSNPEQVKAWGPIIIGILTVFMSLFGQLLLLTFQSVQFRKQSEMAQKQLLVVINKEERSEIIARLNIFYGPMKELRSQHRALYGKFALDIKRKYELAGKRFRTLTYLIEGGLLEKEDKVLFLEILSISKDILKLIENHSGVVDSPALQHLLGKCAAHFRVMQLAYDKKINKRNSVDFDDMVFPLALDGAIESAVLRLQDKLRETSLTAIQENRQTINSSNDTIRYYDENADAYLRDTFFISMSGIYNRFLHYLPPRNGRLLDAGCGVGRDTRFFIEQGYAVVSFDASKEMVDRCNEYPHAYCVQKDFNEIHFKEEFDGVWACASLLHSKKAEAASAIKKLTSALKPKGILFVSLKTGMKNGVSIIHVKSDKRDFVYYDELAATDLAKSEVRLELKESWISINEKKEEWVNLILTRKS